MHLEAHAGVGWALGVLAPGSDRRLRNWCVLAAVLPDVDAVAYLWGPEAYMKWHHTFGHNVFLGALVVLVAAWHHPRHFLAGVMVALAFASHLVSDMKLSAYEVYLFWPASGEPYQFWPNLSLGHPINTAMVYGSFAFAGVLAAWRGVSPLDAISPRLDRIFLNAFRKRTLKCATCERACNNACDSCGKPTCLPHGKLERGFRIRCPACEPRPVSDAAVSDGAPPGRTSSVTPGASSPS